MNYFEAKSLSLRYHLDEWDFKTKVGFIFAVEFFHEEWLKEQEEKRIKENLNGHSFDRDKFCIFCGISNYRYYLDHQVDCVSVVEGLKRGINLNELSRNY